MKWVIGIDEVGRGPLAGPVYVCAAAMPHDAYKRSLRQVFWKGIKDSKQMTELAREKAYLETRSLSIKYAVASRSAVMIDKKGIAVCIRECIASNLRRLDLKNEDCIVLLDGGLKAPVEYNHQQTIIRGDDSQKIISLASVIAKVQRDHYMIALHRKHPQYDWLHNKGYGTKTHIAAIKKWGLTPFHRESFLKRIISR